ncbi:MAG: ornithine cyclodeaminase family protein [Acidobacteriota bacterium]
MSATFPTKEANELLRTPVEANSEEPILYLCRKEVEEICGEIDSVSVMRDLFALHGSGKTILPDEAYLAWTNANGEEVRSLNMPGYVLGQGVLAGTKIINSNPCNVMRGLPRASGLTMLYDGVSTRISCVMDAAHLSSLRTASVTGLAVDLLGIRAIITVAIIGAGALARAHLKLLVRRLPGLRQILLFDVKRERAEELSRELQSGTPPEIDIRVTSTAEEAIRQAQLIIPVTTVTAGYIRFDWLQPGALLSNVSLDDPFPEVVLKAHKVIVDDWKLVKADKRRLIGRMYGEGKVVGPESPWVGSQNGTRRIDAEFGEVVLGTKVGRESDDEIILFNPFGLAIEDVALAAVVYRVAKESGVGKLLER